MRKYTFDRAVICTGEIGGWIYDSFHKPFYRIISGNFTLPRGVFYSNTIIQAREGVKVRKLAPLPKPERNIKRNASKFTFKFIPNKNKVSISLEKGVIFIDPEFWGNLGRMGREFVLAHEIGHYHYKTEEFCDSFARNSLLKKGYNYSQVATLTYSVLSEKSLQRHIYGTLEILNHFSKK